MTRTEASSYAGLSTGRKTASGILRAATRSGMPEPDAVLAGGVRRGGDDAALGGVAAAPDDHRLAGQLGPAEHLDRGDELVEVDVEHPALAHARVISPHRRDRVGGLAAVHAR